MRRKFFLFSTFVAALIVFAACEKTTDAPTEETKTGPVSLILTSNATSVWSESGEIIQFSVMSNDSVDYTDSSVFYVDSLQILGNTFNPPNQTKSYKAYAKYKDLTSNTLSINVFGEDFVFDSILLSLTTDRNIYAGMENQDIFTVTGISSSIGTKDITNLAKLYIDGILMEGKTMPVDTKTYVITAKVGDVTSNALTITILPPPQKFVHRVLVEDFTGTWCPYCPRVLYAIEKLQEQTDKIVPVAIHKGKATGAQVDPYDFNATGPLRDKLDVTAYPTAFINRSTRWTPPEHTTYIDQPLNFIKPSSFYGIAVSSTLGASNGTIDVTFAFSASLPSAKCVVYVVEDGLIYNQANSYFGPSGLFGGGNPILGFEHKDVARAVATDILGNDIPAHKSVENSIYRVSFPSVSYQSEKVENLKVIVCLLDANGSVVNTRVVPANTNKDFEEVQ